MKKGKRKYINPQIHIHTLDKKVSILMGSNPPGDPDDENPFGASTQTPNADRSGQIEFGQDYPFGGERPIYE